MKSTMDVERRPRKIGSKRALWMDALCPAIVLVGVAAVETVVKHYPQLPEPAPLVLVFAAVAGFLTTINSAVLSSLIVVAYSLLFIANRPHTQHTALGIWVESIFLATAAPILAITGALLRQHAHRSADTLKKHLSNTPLGVIELYGDYEIGLWAGAAESIFGILAKDAVGKSLFELPGIFFATEDGVEIRRILEDLERGSQRKGVLHTKSESLESGEGHSRWFWSSTLTASNGQTRFLILVEDITKRVRAEQDLENSKTEMIERLVKATELRDDDTGVHVVRMARYCEALAFAAGLPAEECRMIRAAAPMHDIGKIGIPDHILLKAGKLTDEEFEVIKSHTTVGANVLAGSPHKLIQMAETISLTHHERWDGTGHPNGLKGEEIPLVGRIIAICDVFDALTSPRPYKRAWSVKEAADEIMRCSGTHFDPRLVFVFMSILPKIVAISEEYDKAETEWNTRAA